MIPESNELNETLPDGPDDSFNILTEGEDDISIRANIHTYDLMDN